MFVLSFCSLFKTAKISLFAKMTTFTNKHNAELRGTASGANIPKSMFL